MNAPRILGKYLEWRRQHTPGVGRPLTQQEVLAPTNKHQTNVSKYENLCGYPSRQLISLISTNLKLDHEALWQIVSLAKLNNIPPQECFLSDEDAARLEGRTPSIQLPFDESVWKQAPLLTINDLNEKYYLNRFNELPSYFILEDPAGNRNYCFHNPDIGHQSKAFNKPGDIAYTTDSDGKTHYVSEGKKQYKKS